MKTPSKYHKKHTRLSHEKLVFKALPPLLSDDQLPASVDLRPGMPPVYDQGQLGSCTANALCGIFQYDDPSFMGSRLFLYYNERDIENDVDQDGGAQISDGIQSLQQNGLCPETMWPYDISKFEDKPTQNCYDEALKHKALNVCNIHQNANEMKNSLYNNLPFVVGIQVFQEFESQEVAQTGIVPMPTDTESPLGGHCVSIISYVVLNGQKYWVFRNSYSLSWGDAGYGYLPEEYLLDPNLATDLWVISKIEE